MRRRAAGGVTQYLLSEKNNRRTCAEPFSNRSRHSTEQSKIFRPPFFKKVVGVRAKP